MTADLGEVFTHLPEMLRGQDPYPLLAELREVSPYRAADGVVVVASHEHCTTILRDPRTSSDRSRARIFGGEVRPASRKLVDLDPPDHTRLRRLASRSFTPRGLAPLVPVIDATVRELLDAAASGGCFDVVAELASPLALRTICAQLGVPEADRELLGEWSRTLSRALYPLPLGSAGHEATQDITKAGARMVAYFKNLLAGPDPAVAAWEGLSESERLGLCALLLNAGYETTVGLIGNGIRALVEHPGQLERLRADPGLAPAAVEEVLRYDSPAQFTTRVATADTVLGGVRIAAGDFLVLLLGAANRDPAVFARPDDFDLGRRPPIPHLAFAAGPHFCLGGGLARLEGAAALAAFAGRVAEPRLASEPIPYRRTPSLRGPESLRVTFGELRAAASPQRAGSGRRRA